MSHDEIIEQAARVLARLEPGEDWPTNESLGGGMMGTRDDEFRQEMIDQATELWDAGLLARPLPTRDEIATAIADGWNSVTTLNATAQSIGPSAAADAVLELLKGQDR